MARIYGHKWSSITESDDGTWLAGLQDLTPADISVGLGAILKNANEWPPSLPEFRRLCLNQGDELHNTAAYRDYTVDKALPSLKAQKSVANREREAIREYIKIKSLQS